MFVEDLQRRIGIQFIIVTAVHADALSGQRDGIHLVKIAFGQALCKINDIAQRQIRADILIEDLCILRDFGNGDCLNAFLCQRTQEVLLNLSAADIRRRVAVAVAA